MIINPIERIVSEKGIYFATYWSAKKLNYSVERKGMYIRNKTESLLHKIMGDVAMIATYSYFQEQGIPTLAYDNIRTDKFKEEDPGWDLVVTSGNPIDPERILRGDFSNCMTVSVKSSRIPEADESLLNVIKRRDFKILKYNTRIDYDIKNNIEVQVYYEKNEITFSKVSLDTSSFNQFNQHIKLIEKASSADECKESLTWLIKNLNLKERWSHCYLLAFNFREEIIGYSNSIDKKVWTSYHEGEKKEMWIAPLKYGHDLSTFKTKVSEKGKA